jgi:hypothetical protein
MNSVPLIVTPDLDEASHVYTVDGIVKPGLHEILELNGYLKGMEFVPEWYRTFGKHGHLMTHLYDRGELDEAQLDPQLVPVLDAYKDFLKRTGCQVVASELRLWCQLLDYCTTIDKNVFMLGRFGLLELKITERVQSVVEKQLCGQDTAWEDNHPDQPYEFKYVLQITRSGEWSLVTKWTNSPKAVWEKMMTEFWKKRGL